MTGLVKRITIESVTDIMVMAKKCRLIHIDPIQHRKRRIRRYAGWTLRLTRCHRTTP